VVDVSLLGFGDEYAVNRARESSGARLAFRNESRSGRRSSQSGFADGNSFLATARARPPACIILDVELPGRSGLDILKELNAQNCGAPIFIISDQGDVAMAVDAIKNGAFDFIEKPFDADAVVARVRNAIDAWTRWE
jgi:FixJ family two-component response regulator